MTFLAKDIHQNEELLVETHPHWRPLCAPALLTAAAIFVFLATALLWGNARMAVAGLLLLGIVVPAVWLILRCVHWANTWLVVTSSRLLLQKGPLGRQTQELSLHRVLHVHVRQSTSERLWRTGTLMVSLKTGGVWVIPDVSSPRATSSVINDAARQVAGAAGAAPGSPDRFTGPVDLGYR